jgi:hypothetical protein
MLFSYVVVRLFVLAKYNSLADEIKHVRTVAEATIGSVKVIKARNCGDSSVVVSSVIKDKVT